jgi:hypothetical protein
MECSQLLLLQKISSKNWLSTVFWNDERILFISDDKINYCLKNPKIKSNLKKRENKEEIIALILSNKTISYSWLVESGRLKLRLCLFKSIIRLELRMFLAAELIQDKKEHDTNNDDLNGRYYLSGSWTILVPGLWSISDNAAALGVAKAKNV